MAIAYRIYSNGGTGGPVDYSAPVASATGPGYVSAPLPVSSDTTFAVRAFDPGTGLEEANTEAQVRVVLDGQGADVSGRPNPPHAVGLAPAPGGGCRVNWAYRPDPWSGAPDGFQVYLTQVGSARGGSPAATVAYAPGQVGYRCVLPGPFGFATYTAVVESYNAAGADGGTAASTAAVGLPATPLLMDAVAARVLGITNNGSSGRPA
jgi:hypothetical protein